MNSSTFLSCSCDSSPPVKGSGIAASPRARVRRCEDYQMLGASMQRKQARHVCGAIVALHVAKGLDAGSALARLDLRFAQAQLRVLRALQPALLDALLH